jgi:hypothetical protein
MGAEHWGEKAKGALYTKCVQEQGAEENTRA